MIVPGWLCSCFLPLTLCCCILAPLLLEQRMDILRLRCTHCLGKREQPTFRCVLKDHGTYCRNTSQQ